MRIDITGDCHGQFYGIEQWCREEKTTKEDILCITGDAGINYYGYVRDREKKEYLQSLPITLFCVHGNHERRPENLPGYGLVEFHGGMAYVEKEFPNLIFAKDGEVYDFHGVQTIVLGGAYSVDKYYRLAMGYLWFPDEQPSEETKEYVEKQLEDHNWKVDVVLSHTAPLKYEPREKFIQGLDQSRVDKSTEEWLDKIENKLSYKHWYAGHYHCDKQVDKMHFLYADIVDFPEKKD